MLLLATVLFLALSACSPEATRTRSGGPGADVGNHAPDPQIAAHGPTNPSFGEPVVGRAVTAK